MQNVRKSTDYVDRRTILCEVHFKHRCGHWSMRGICLILYIYIIPSLVYLIYHIPTTLYFGTEKQIDKEFLKRNSRATRNYINMRVHLACKMLKSL